MFQTSNPVLEWLRSRGKRDSNHLNPATVKAYGIANKTIGTHTTRYEASNNRLQYIVLGNLAIKIQMI
jgi:hypothetical protein